jgi:hypothetical protein
MRGIFSKLARSFSPRRGSVLLVLAVICLSGTGCRLLPGERLAPPFEPQNIYVSSAALPEEIRRVAVLPMATDEKRSILLAGRETLEPVFNAELVKTRKFEVVSLSVEQMRTLTGQNRWAGSEALPHDFMERLQESSGCDAVLFCELTTYRPYAPLAIGWRMKLIDVRSRQILWAGDELFDAGESAVKNGARRYQESELKALHSGEWAIENSPRYFGQYAIARLLETLPAR